MQHASSLDEVELATESLLALRAGVSRLDALRLIREREQQSTDLRMGPADTVLAGLAALFVFAASRSAGETTGVIVASGAAIAAVEAENRLARRLVNGGRASRK